MAWPLSLRKRSITASLPEDAAEGAAEELMAMDAAIEALGELPGLSEFPNTRTLPAGFLKLARDAMAAYDRYTRVVLRYGDAGKALPVTCSEGCHGCCHDAPTGVHVLEHLLAYRAARARPDYEHLHNLAVDRAEALHTHVRRLAPDRTSFKTDDRVFQRALLAYRNTVTPCAFLDGETKLCRIYEARPIPCRMHVSLTPPEWCWPGHPAARKANTPNLPPPRSIVEELKSLAARMGLQNLSPVFFSGFVELSALMNHEPLEEAAAPRKTKRRGRN